MAFSIWRPISGGRTCGVETSMLSGWKECCDIRASRSATSRNESRPRLPRRCEPGVGMAAHEVRPEHARIAGARTPANRACPRQAPTDGALRREHARIAGGLAPANRACRVNPGGRGTAARAVASCGGGYEACPRGRPGVTRLHTGSGGSSSGRPLRPGHTAGRPRRPARRADRRSPDRARSPVLLCSGCPAGARSEFTARRPRPRRPFSTS